MPSFEIDLSELANELSSHRIKSVKSSEPINRVPFSINQHKFKKIAFDMFQSQFDGTIWELQEEGESRFLVKRTDLEDSPLSTVSEETPGNYRKGYWSLSNAVNAMTLSYVNIPVKAFRDTDYNFNNETRHIFAETVLDELEKNDKLVTAYLKKMESAPKRQLTQYCKRNLIDKSSRRLYALLDER